MLFTFVNCVMLGAFHSMNASEVFICRKASGILACIPVILDVAVVLFVLAWLFTSSY
jgi:hypothetical protein